MRKFSLLLFIAFPVSLNVNAQGKLTLPDAISIALKNSYNIQLAKDNVEIASINNNIGVAGGLPIVNAQLIDNQQITSITQKFPDPTRNLQRDGVSANNMTANVTASILLYNGFRVKAAKSRLEELARLNQGLLNAQIQNTLAAVNTSYYNVVRHQYFLKSINQSIEVSKNRLFILNSRKEVGLANNADIYQAQLDLNTSIQLAEAQTLVINQSKTDLLNTIFVNPDSSIVISDTIIIDRTVNIAEIKSLSQKNPQLIASEQQIIINQYLEREVAALRFPTLRATTGYNLSNTTSAAGFILQNQSFGPQVGLNLAIPIYNGSINKRQHQVAEVNTRIAKTQRDNLLLNIETGVVRTYQTYTSTLDQLKTSKENYELSIKLLDLVMQKFQLGQATIIDVRVAQQSFEIESFRLANLAFTAKVAEIELKRLANLLQP
jgi:outer membrane protein